MKLFVILLGLVLAALAAPFLLPVRQQALDATALPWQVDILPGGRSKALGLTLPTSVLSEANAKFGPEVELGLIVDPGGERRLEAYFPGVRLGFITGRVVATLSAPAPVLAAMLDRATDGSAMKSGGRKYRLASPDADAARAFEIRAIAFMPSADLSENTIVERFGPPGERLVVSDAVEHWLYPAKGIALVLDREGKEIIQYVAPSAFDSVRVAIGSAAGARPQ